MLPTKKQLEDNAREVGLKCFELINFGKFNELLISLDFILLSIYN